MTQAGSVVPGASVVIAHLRSDPELTARLAAASTLRVPWIVAQYDLPLVTRDAHFKAVQRLDTLGW